MATAANSEVVEEILRPYWEPPVFDYSDYTDEKGHMFTVLKTRKERRRPIEEYVLWEDALIEEDLMGRYEAWIVSSRDAAARTQDSERVRFFQQLHHDIGPERLETKLEANLEKLKWALHELEITHRGRTYEVIYGFRDYWPLFRGLCTGGIVMVAIPIYKEAIETLINTPSIVQRAPDDGNFARRVAELLETTELEELDPLQAQYESRYERQWGLQNDEWWKLAKKMWARYRGPLKLCARKYDELIFWDALPGSGEGDDSTSDEEEDDDNASITSSTSYQTAFSDTDVDLQEPAENDPSTSLWKSRCTIM